jgi:F-type H+-transporting ATPase subunit gamma
MPKMREIKKRMVAVKNIQRITKTMQMIATAKFAASLQRATETKPFADKIRQLVGEVAAAAGDVENPLIDGPPSSVGREYLLLISSDRGLCGAYNGNIFRVVDRYIRERESEGVTLDLDTAGKKANAFCRFRGLDVAESHSFGDKPKYEEIAHLGDRLIDEFKAGKYDAVKVAYMRFESNARQVPEVLTLMPLKPEAIEQSEPSTPGATYEFSPSSEELLQDLLPLTVKTSLFQAFNDAVVSEQIMRIVAMKSATENAKDIGKLLNRSYNRARQSQITTELTEIISGAAALE